MRFSEELNIINSGRYNLFECSNFKYLVMKSKILLAIVLTFVVTTFATTYAIYLLQARSLSVGVSESFANRMPEEEDESGSEFSDRDRLGGSERVGASISFFNWIRYSVSAKIRFIL